MSNRCVKVGDEVTATLKGTLTEYDPELGIWTLTTDGTGHVPWRIKLHWAQPFEPAAGSGTETDR